MAMSGPDLASAIRTAIAGVADPKSFEDVWNAVGTALVAYITANASVAVTVTSVSGVTTGSGVSGAGTGTGTIT